VNRYLHTIVNSLFFFGAMLFCALGCDDSCVDESNPSLWPPTGDEYVLEFSNNSDHMVELFVDGESVGVFCEGLSKLPVGIFPKDECSKIMVRFFDNPDEIYLDDCEESNLGGCKENNIDGICYNTALLNRVEANIE